MATREREIDGDDEITTEVGGMELILEGAGTVSALEGAQIDVQIATAKRYPRSVTKSLQEAMTLATLDADTAKSMHYLLPRSGKKIPGPSVRLAEVMAYTWGNLRVDAAVVEEGKTHLTAMASCFDLEKNMALRIQVKRRITDSKGNRYNDDMIGVTGNAAVSVAYRNAIFKVIPAALVQRIYNAARSASLGKGTMAEKRQRGVEWFVKRGVKPADVFRIVGVAGLDDLGEEQLIDLAGIANAIHEGETTIEAVFAPDNASTKTESRAEEIDQRTAQHAAQQQNGGAEPKKAEPAAKGKGAKKAEPNPTEPAAAAPQEEPAPHQEEPETDRPKDTKLAAYYDKYMAKTAELGWTADQIVSFHERLKTNGMLSSINIRDWNRTDYMQALVELDDIARGPTDE